MICYNWMLLGRQNRRYTLTPRVVYHVPGPFYLVHIDGNHKLNMYGLVIVGGIDGYSRLITFLKCSDNNRASTMFTLVNLNIILFLTLII